MKVVSFIFNYLKKEINLFLVPAVFFLVSGLAYFYEGISSNPVDSTPALMILPFQLFILVCTFFRVSIWLALFLFNLLLRGKKSSIFPTSEFLLILLLCISSYFSIGSIISCQLPGLYKIAFDPFIQSCPDRTIYFGNDGKLGVCSYNDHDPNIMVTDVPIYNAILFDSTDQIVLPENKRSESWRNAMQKLHVSGLYFGIPNNMSVLKITKHYYWLSGSFY